MNMLFIFKLEYGFLSNMQIRIKIVKSCPKYIMFGLKMLEIPRQTRIRSLFLNWSKVRGPRGTKCVKPEVAISHESEGPQVLFLVY